MTSREKNRKFQSKSEASSSSEPPAYSFKQKIYTSIISPIRFFFIKLRELFLGRTDKQLAADKPSFLGKRMLFLLGIFLLLSFTLFVEMNRRLFEGTFLLTFFNLFTFNRPYVYGIASCITFILISLLNCNDKFHLWFFGKLYALKQFLFILALMIGSFLLVSYLQDQNVDFYSSLLVFAMLWLIFQSIRIFNSAQNGATKTEAKISERYSPFLYFIAVITPFVTLGILTFLSWVFRYYIVIFTLDYIGHPDIQQPDVALEIYSKEMGTIMPMIYIGLFFVFVLMLAQMILSRKKGVTKRAGAYDNFTFGLIALVMYLYAIYNIALYLFLDETFLQGFNTLLGSESHGNTAFFVEYLITIVFLIWIVIDLHRQFDKGVLFFSKDGMVMFLMGTIFAQTTARLGIVTGDANINSVFANIIQYDYVVLPWFFLIFLGFTIVLYWIKPQEMSMFLHMSKSAVKEEDKGMENILRFLKREFIRRGEKYEISSDIISSLRKITSYPSGVIWSLIYRLNDQYIDVHLQEEKDDDGNKIVYFDFLPITQRYQKSKEADKRAQAYLQNYFVQSIQKQPRKKISLSKQKLSSSKQTDVFIQSLSFNYAKKVKKEEEIKEEQIKGDYFQEDWINRKMDEQTKDLVYELIKKEYIRRMTRIADYPNEFRFRISDIASTIEKATAVPVGRVFSLLHNLAVENWNFQLSADFVDVDHPDDRLIEFLPIDDWEVYSIMREYRPEALKEINVLMQTWFDRNIHFTRKHIDRLSPIVYKDDDEEFERSFRSKWFAQTIHYFAQHFTERENIRKIELRYIKLQRAIEKISGQSVNWSNKEYIYDIIRSEYMTRLKDPKHFPEYQFFISEIAPIIEKKVKVSLVRIFPIIEELAKTNWDLELTSGYDAEGKEILGDKRITFIPIDDFELYDLILKYRPKDTQKIHHLMKRWFLINIQYDRKNLRNIPPQVYNSKELELQRSFRSHWFADLMRFLAKNYATVEKERKKILDYKKIKYLINEIVKGVNPEQKL